MILYECFEQLKLVYEQYGLDCGVIRWNKNTRQGEILTRQLKGGPETKAIANVLNSETKQVKPWPDTKNMLMVRQKVVVISTNSFGRKFPAGSWTKSPPTVVYIL